MYKVSDVAERLGVQNTDIFEKMIAHRALLNPHLNKVDGVIYFDDRGVEILKTLCSKAESEASEVPAPPEHSEAPTKPKTEGKRTYRSRSQRERDVLHDQIQILKSEIFNLDAELEHKDEMILDYQKKIFEDMERINRLQYRFLKITEREG